MTKQPDDLTERQASHHQRKLLTCKHFNGALGLDGKPNICRAGIAYREHVGGDDFGWIMGLPCLPQKVGNRQPREIIPCELREFPTKAEVEKQEAKSELLFALVAEAITLCRKDADGKRGVAGSIICPACGGILRYTISSYNAHIHGRCGTAGCLGWMT